MLTQVVQHTVAPVDLHSDWTVSGRPILFPGDQDVHLGITIKVTRCQAADVGVTCIPAAYQGLACKGSSLLCQILLCLQDMQGLT